MNYEKSQDKNLLDIETIKNDIHNLVSDRTLLYKDNIRPLQISLATYILAILALLLSSRFPILFLPAIAVIFLLLISIKIYKAYASNRKYKAGFISYLFKNDILYSKIKLPKIYDYFVSNKLNDTNTIDAMISSCEDYINGKKLNLLIDKGILAAGLIPIWIAYVNRHSTYIDIQNLFMSFLISYSLLFIVLMLAIYQFLKLFNTLANIFRSYEIEQYNFLIKSLKDLKILLLLNDPGPKPVHLRSKLYKYTDDN